MWDNVKVAKCETVSHLGAAASILTISYETYHYPIMTPAIKQYIMKRALSSRAFCLPGVCKSPWLARWRAVGVNTDRWPNMRCAIGAIRRYFGKWCSIRCVVHHCVHCDRGAGHDGNWGVRHTHLSQYIVVVFFFLKKKELAMSLILIPALLHNPPIHVLQPPCPRYSNPPIHIRI